MARIVTLLNTQVLLYINTVPDYLLTEDGVQITDEDLIPIVVTGGEEWILDGSALNELDTGGVLDGDVAVDISDYLRPDSSVSIVRGRSDQFAEFDVGTATIQLEDVDRRFDSTHTASPFFGQLTAGKRVDVLVNGVTLFSGAVRTWRSTYRQNASVAVTLVAEDALAILGRRKFTAWTSTAAATPRERILEVLARNEVTYTGTVDLDPGLSPLQSDSVTAGSSVLNYLQLVVKSDFGRLFASRVNALTFEDRLAVAGGAVAFTLDENGTGVDIEGVTRSDDAKGFFTRVSVDRVGGVRQTSVNAQAEIDYDGARAMAITGLLLTSDDDSLYMADYLVAVLSVPEQRIESANVNVMHVPAALLPAVLAVDMAQTVRFVWTPLNIGTAIDVNLIVERVEHQISAYDHVMSLGFSTTVNRSPWTLEDVILGSLDTGGVLSF